jgi:hypothetical protein
VRVSGLGVLFCDDRCGSSCISPAAKKEAPLPGPKNLKSIGWFVDRCVDRRRPVDRLGRASGSAADVAGRSSGRRHLAAGHLVRLVGSADWTSIAPSL